MVCLKYLTKMYYFSIHDMNIYTCIYENVPLIFTNFFNTCIFSEPV